jgi:hypothetical protein
LPRLNSCQAKNKFSREIISSKILWHLIPPPNEFNIPLLHRIFEFYKLCYQYIQLFPKKDKYTLGQKIENLILDVFELIFLAANSRKEEKSNILQKTSLKIDLLKILIRLAKEIRALDIKKYIQLEQELQEIGKMLGGWMRSLKLY